MSDASEIKRKSSGKRSLSRKSRDAFLESIETVEPCAECVSRCLDLRALQIALVGHAMAVIEHVRTLDRVKKHPSRTVARSIDGMVETFNDVQAVLLRAEHMASHICDAMDTDGPVN